MTKAWSAYVELAARDVPEPVIDQIHEHLADHYPAVGYAPNGNLSVQLSIDAATARQATDAALKTITATAKQHQITSNVLGVEVITEDELDRRIDEPAVPALVGISEVAAMFGVVRQRAVQLAAREDFPPAVARLKSGPVFVKDQVVAFGKRWSRTNGRPRKPSKQSGQLQHAGAA